MGTFRIDLELENRCRPGAGRRVWSWRKLSRGSRGHL